MDLFQRLERDWREAFKIKKYKDLGIIIRICAKNCGDEKSLKKLNKWVAFIQGSIDNIPLKDLARVLSDINYAISTLAKARRVAPGESSGKYLSGELTALHRRAAARTLNNAMVANLKNDQLALGDDTDLAAELRSGSMDLE